MTGSLRNTTGNTFQFQNLDEEEDEGPDRVSKMDIDFNDSHVEVQGNSPSSNHGRSANVSLANKEWEQNDTGIPIPNFSQKEGPTKILPVNSTELDFFLLLVDNRILNNIVKESNIYAEQSLKAAHQDVSKWNKIDLAELKAFLGLLIVMSIHKVPWLRDYWSESWALGVPAFAQVMPRNRFFDILVRIHLANNENMPQHGEQGFDKLYKVRNFLDSVRANFLSNYDPHRQQAIDEAMVKYKGRTSLKQYMPMKPIKRGIKIWCRADSRNGYLCDFDVYTGRQETGIQHGLGYSVVTKLCEAIKGHWYGVFFDNFFTSYRLVEDLYSRYKILSVGTLRSGRVGFPSFLSDKTLAKSLKRGEMKWRMKGPILALTWMDKKLVQMTGTYTSCPGDILPLVKKKKKDGTLENVPCPDIIREYNAYMGGVDRNDQMKSYYTIPCAGKKWWMRIFLDILDRAIHNSNILHNESPNHSRQSLKTFRINLAQSLIGDFSSRRRTGNPPFGPLEKRFVERHFPEIVPLNEKGRHKERRCYVCSRNGKRKQVIYFCPDCDVGLCPAPCFKDYHTN